MVEPVPAGNNRGRTTGTRSRVNETGTWLLNVVYYDKYGKVLQSVENTLTGALIRTSNIYDFRGKPVKSCMKHIAGTGKITTLRKRFTYDHADRLLKTFLQVDSLQEIVLSENRYNELGQLVEKKLHSAGDDGHYLQNIHYAYNIRGWLKTINDPDRPGESLFAMKLGYDQPGEGLEATSQYNGNIASMEWNTKDLQEKKGYGFAYDELNRLKKAHFSNGTTGPEEDYSVPEIGYDLNGNIDTLARMGLIAPGHYDFVDKLQYSYRGNRLIAVDDDGEKTETGKDFSDHGSKFGPDDPEPEYKYDANGNLVSDANKGILKIRYNHLNLPKEIWFENNRLIRYFYDAAGKKLRKEVFDETGRLTDEWDYECIFVSRFGNPEFISTDEGRVIMDTTGYQYEYFLKDHLGNIRVAFRAEGDSAMITQENHYYPFGGEMQGLARETTPASEDHPNRYRYNGKEFQPDFDLDWYDYGARMYDPQVGRWWSNDPLAEKKPGWTPNNYVRNNPLLLVDPTGMEDGKPLDGAENDQGQKYNAATGQWVTSDQYENWQRDFGNVETGIIENNALSTSIDAQTLFLLGLGITAEKTQNTTKIFQISNMNVKAAAIRNNMPTKAIDNIMVKTSKLANGAKWVGRSAVVLGAGISVYQGYDAYTKGDMMGVEKAGLDLGVGLIAASVGGIPGVLIYGSYMLMMQTPRGDSGYKQSNVLLNDKTYVARTLVPVNKIKTIK